MKKMLLFLIIFSLALIQISNAQSCEKFIGSECSELQWERADAKSGEIAEIVISPTNPDIMYAGIEVNAHSLYKSTNGGKNWRRINGGGDHTKDVAVSPKEPNKVYFAMSETIHSTDLSVTPTVRSKTSPAWQGGETIDILSTGRPPGPAGASFSTIEIFEQDDKIIYAAMKGGNLGPFGSVKPVIFKTINGGNIWTRIEPDLDEVNVIEIHPVNHELIYIGSSDGLYISKDSGKTLEKLKSTRALGGFISIELQKDNPNVIYIASSSEVFKSDDVGKTWQDITGSLSDIHRVRISWSHPNILYASTFKGVFRSDNYGKTWIDKSSNLKAKNIQIVTIHPKNPDIAFVGHSSLWSSVRAEHRYKFALWADNGIFKTVDGGNSWFRSDDGIFEYNLEEVAVSPHKPNEAWVASPASRGGYKTIDSAHNWMITQIQTMHYPMRIKYSMQNLDKIYATSWHIGGTFALSEDGGASWRLTSEQEFFKGVNRGRSLFNPGGQEQIHMHGLAVDPNNDNIVYAGSVHDARNPGDYPLEGSHIFKSTDTGKTWQESDEGFPHEKYTAIHDIQIDPKNTDVIYVATTEHEAKVGIGIYKSTDAGKTWQAINNGLGDLNIGAIAIHPENTELLLSATHSGLYKSKNSGLSWTKTSSSHSFDVEYVQNEPNIVYASTNDGVLKGRDFGDNWYKVNYGLPTGEGQGIGVSIDGNVVYTAVKNYGVYVARIKPVDQIEPVSVITNRGFEYAMGFETRGFDMPDFLRREEGREKVPPISRERFPISEEECRHQPPDCNVIPVPEFRKYCEECKKRGIVSKFEEIPFYEEKERRPLTLEECIQYNYPDKCTDVDNPEDINDCEECKKLVARTKELLKEKPVKKEGIFTKIVNFFKGIFSRGEKQDKDRVEQSVPQSSSKIPKQHPEQIVEEKSYRSDEPQTARQESIDTSQENKLSAIQKGCIKQSLIPAGKYQGLLTDVHVHTMIRDNAFDFSLKLIEEMNEQGVDRIVIQPNHDPRKIAPNSQLDKAWGDISAVCSRIIPLIYGFNPDEPDAWKYVQELLNTGNYGGVGEIEFQHGNLPIKHNPESASMLKIYEMLNERRLALHFQASIQRDPSLEEKMFKIILRYPNINFIWFGGCPFTEKFLSLPNLYCDIFLHSQSKASGNILQKSIIGSDAGPEGFWNPAYGMLPYQNFGEAMKQAREQLGVLPVDVRDKLAHGNFDRVWKKQKE